MRARRSSSRFRRDSNVFAYVLEGSGAFGSDAQTAKRAQLVVFGPNGDIVRIRAGVDEALDVIVLAGRPLREPVVRYGPFVMNTKTEIVEAFDDYQSGRMGQITAS